MPTDKPAPKELKVTDKRIFTADGDIRDEFKQEIRPAEPVAAQAAEPQAETPAAQPQPEPPKQQQPPQQQQRPQADERRRPAAGPERERADRDRAASPETPFANFIEPLIAQAYMSLGLLRNPYQPQAKIDPAAARQMIDILVLLQEKTAGNLTPEEEDFLTTHLGELKLAYVQRTKSI